MLLFVWCFSGLPLAMALLPYQRFHGGVFPRVRRALLLLQAADHRPSQHHPLLRLHHDHGLDLLPLHRCVGMCECVWVWLQGGNSNIISPLHHWLFSYYGTPCHALFLTSFKKPSHYVCVFFLFFLNVIFFTLQLKIKTQLFPLHRNDWILCLFLVCDENLQRGESGLNSTNQSLDWTLFC